jgi:hypothetical protein
VLAVDAVDAVLIGQTVFDRDRLPTPVTIRSMEVVVTPGSFRIRAWCGTQGENYLSQVMRNITGRLTDQRLTGIYRYRVVNMNGTRVDLQAVKRGSSLTQMPDNIAVAMTPGVAGAHATLTPGDEVYVQFVDGNRDDPVITNFAGRENPASVPQLLELGGESGSPIARQGDNVTTPFPPTPFTGSALIGGTPTPITGVLTPVVAQLVGSITGPCAQKVTAK